METDLGTSSSNRPLSNEECELALWMLRHGGPDSERYISQLDQAEVTSWRCPCGCASFNFQIRGKPLARPGVHVLGDFVFGDDEKLRGIFIFESGGILSGVEVCGMAGDAPTSLPNIGDLRPLG